MDTNPALNPDIPICWLLVNQAGWMLGPARKPTQDYAVAERFATKTAALAAGDKVWGRRYVHAIAVMPGSVAAGLMFATSA